MPENGMPGPVCDLSSVRESVCIHTKKIYDSCRDKDCIEDLRFYPNQAAQKVLRTDHTKKGGWSRSPLTGDFTPLTCDFSTG